MSTILRVVSSQECIDLVKYTEKCKIASLLIAKNFPWVKVNYTLHGLLHHSPELITLNNYYGLGSLSEEGLEATNKYIRRYLELLSRKTDPIHQMSDVMAHLLERSNPLVTAKITAISQINNNIFCLLCDAKDHKTKDHEKKAGPDKYYDYLVKSMFLHV